MNNRNSLPESRFMNACEMVKTIRVSRNMSQSSFGKKIGVSGKTISAYERGKITPTYNTIRKIAETFNVSFINIASNKKNFLEQKILELQKTLHELKNTIDSELSF